MDKYTQMEALALAVLRKDMDAARALCDMIQEEEALGVRIPPVKKIAVDVDKIRVCVFFPARIDGEDTEIVDVEGINEMVTNWIVNGGSLVLRGAERIEIYEMSGRA